MKKRNTDEPKAKPWRKAIFVGFIVSYICGGMIYELLHRDFAVFGLIIGLIVMFIVLHGGVKNAAIQVTAAAKRVSSEAKEVVKEAEKTVGIKKDIKAESVAYEKAAEEIENKSQNKGMWAKAFADADGDEQNRKLYI